MGIGMKDVGGEEVLCPAAPTKKCCGIFTTMADSGDKPCSRPTRCLVSLKEADGTAQTRSVGALCMRDNGGVHSWG